MIKAYKLFALRRDGSIGPLFINRRQRIQSGRWLQAETHPTKGFKVRGGWHAVALPVAPHLSPKGRVWREVWLDGVTSIPNPDHQGGRWYIADRMRLAD